MPITVSCPNCSTSGELPDIAAGQVATCPKCQTQVQVPRPFPVANETDGFGIWVDSPALGAVSISTPLLVESPPPTPPFPDLPADPTPIPARATDRFDDAPDPAVRAEAGWFDEYVSKQLARLHSLRQELADNESQNETAHIRRAMELNQSWADLKARSGALDRREAEIRTASDVAASRKVEIERQEKDLADRETALAGRAKDRAKLEAEALDLAKLVAELRPAVERMERRKTEAEAVLAELSESRATLDRRQIEVGRAELALDRRIAELDLTEKELREELEEREAEIERQRAVLVEELRTARPRVQVEPETPIETSLTSPTPACQGGAKSCGKGINSRQEFRRWTVSVAIEVLPYSVPQLAPSLDGTALQADNIRRSVAPLSGRHPRCSHSGRNPSTVPP